MTQHAVIVLGHGSRSPEATEQFLRVTEMLAPRLPGRSVIPAFMELAVPSLADAVKRAVDAGASDIVVQPCFLFMGNHIKHDIPEKVAEAAQPFPSVSFEIREPIGPDPRIVELLLDRLGHSGHAVWGQLGPEEIEANSMAIISASIATPDDAIEAAVVRRLVHASGDLSLGGAVEFSPGAAAAGVAALRTGAPVITDVRMVQAGIDAARLGVLGGSTRCLIDDPAVAEEALETGRTRSATAMRRLASEIDGAIVAIGNAPSALREIIVLAQEGVARPALVVGIPVGFVDAAESKSPLAASDLPYITVRGSRGGSPLAAAAINALLRSASEVPGPVTQPAGNTVIAPMRSGLTTGTCAAAAAKAAALALVGTTVSTVEVDLPGGEHVMLAVEAAEALGEGVARATVVKDAGDDPDITNGSRVVVTLALGGKRVRFSAGDGVGTVTREGLQLAVGEPAINPVPRAMIAEAIGEVLGSDVGVLVTVAIPGGAELAAKTFNPRLGIQGGLSVIGTTGRVEPKSSEAWMRSLLPQIDVVLAAGYQTVWLTPGGIGEAFAVGEMGAPADAVVQCSNFVGELLDYCGQAGVQHVVLVGHAGKLVKVAAGIFDTHSGAGDARLETVAALAAAEGAPGPVVVRLLELATVQAAITELADARLAHVWDVIAQRAAVRASGRCGVPTDVVLIGYKRELLGASERAPVVSRRESDATAGRLAVVGVGPGAEEYLLPAAWREIRRAEAVAGGLRLLEAFAPPAARRIPIGGDVGAAFAQVREALEAGLRTVVLASGDPGFFGVLASVRRELPDVEIEVVPGISSAQLALARLGVSWEGVAFASAHGRDPEAALAACERNERTLVLADRDASPQVLAAALEARKPGAFRVSVCERFGYPGERISAGSASDIADGVFDSLALLLVERSEGGQRGSPSLSSAQKPE